MLHASSPRPARLPWSLRGRQGRRRRPRASPRDRPDSKAGPVATPAKRHRQSLIGGMAIKRMRFPRQRRPAASHAGLPCSAGEQELAKETGVASVSRRRANSVGVTSPALPSGGGLNAARCWRQPRRATSCSNMRAELDCAQRHGCAEQAGARRDMATVAHLTPFD